MVTEKEEITVFSNGLGGKIADTWVRVSMQDTTAANARVPLDHFDSFQGLASLIHL